MDQVAKQLHKLIDVLKIRDLEPRARPSRASWHAQVAADG